MKQTPQLSAIQREMKPGVLTRDGFLGTDTRTLAEILDADAAAVRRLGLDHAAIAARLRALRDAGAKGLGLAVACGPDLEVRVDSVRGKLPCPFGHAGLFPKVNTTVRNTRTGREFTFTDLNLHLIEAHGFYEGRGASFRIDPEDAVASLSAVL
jgi:hypothetical protein